MSLVQSHEGSTFLRMIGLLVRSGYWNRGADRLDGGSVVVKELLPLSRVVTDFELPHPPTTMPAAHRSTQRSASPSDRCLDRCRGRVLDQVIEDRRHPVLRRNAGADGRVDMAFEVVEQPLLISNEDVGASRRAE